MDIAKIVVENLNLTAEWDKTFPKSDKVDHQKVTFVNRYGITLAADLYKPKGEAGPFAAIAVSGPYGAVKEQSSGLYAQTLAERGFLTIAFDPSFTGESDGNPRYTSSPDINTEDYSAAVDFLMLRPDVAPEKIGILGICGWGGICINAAANDPRIKATVSSTLGSFDSIFGQQLRDFRKQLADQRLVDLKNGYYQRAGGVPAELPDDAPDFMKDYHDYYKTQRGYHPRSLNSTDGWNTTVNLAWITFPLLDRAGEIESAVMLIHGNKAYSLQGSKDAYAKLDGARNKLLHIIPGATHTDLYDNLQYIPFDQIERFYREYLG